ncbi:blood vessel epicardial substance-like [Ptychodera flava]|uniref:blood vessel epicardial substance-like n=1 Tax=Ptychodera flava TaxID=63121 RepID=UPI00396A218B
MSTLPSLLQEIVTATAVPQSSSEEDTPGGVCPDWSEPHHALFQVGHLTLVVALVTPTIFQHHALFLRVVLVFAFLFLYLWAITVSCMPDFFGWNLVFFIVNIAQVVRIVYSFWPVGLDIELESTYDSLFKPLQMPRSNFKNLSKHGCMFSLKKGDFYAIEFKTAADERLSILLSGSVRVTSDDIYLHTVKPNEFLDAPEWESCKSGYGDVFQVTLTALEDCRYISWPRKNLESHLKKHQFTKAILNSLIGKDVSRKLFAMNEYVVHLDEATPKNDDFNDIDGINIGVSSLSHLTQWSQLQRGNSVVSSDLGE